MKCIGSLADIFFLLPGFPGTYSRFQIVLILVYILTVANSFAMFTLSLQHQYAQYALSIEVWLALSAIGAGLSTIATAMYTALFRYNKRTFTDPRAYFLGMDAIRIVLCIMATFIYAFLITSILFIYIYTANNLEVRNLLSNGFNTYGPLGFIERRLDAFLTWCQLNFMFHLLPIAIELLIHSNKNKLQALRQ